MEPRTNDDINPELGASFPMELKPWSQSHVYSSISCESVLGVGLISRQVYFRKKGHYSNINGV